MVTIKPCGSTCVCNGFTKEGIATVSARFRLWCNSSAASIIKVGDICFDMRMSGRRECRRFARYIVPCDICNSSSFAYVPSAILAFVTFLLPRSLARTALSNLFSLIEPSIISLLPPEEPPELVEFPSIIVGAGLPA